MILIGQRLSLHSILMTDMVNLERIRDRFRRRNPLQKMYYKGGAHLASLFMSVVKS